VTSVSRCERNGVQIGDYFNPTHGFACVANIMEDGVGSFQNRCRLCISEAKLSLNLFQTEAMRLNIINKIRTYLTIQVSVV
jgi:hypothetical protein